jgi:hypothetical protein
MQLCLSPGTADVWEDATHNCMNVPLDVPLDVPAIHCDIDTEADYRRLLHEQEAE